MGFDVPDPLPYLRDISTANFKECADASFVLTDAGHLELPFHSTMLCAKSTFFMSFFLSQAERRRSDMIKVPLPDLDLEDTLAFLNVVYRPDGFDDIRPKSCAAAAKLFHKFDMKGFLSKSDAILAGMTDPRRWGECLWVSHPI